MQSRCVHCDMLGLFTFAGTYLQSICSDPVQIAADYRLTRSRGGAAIRNRLPQAAPTDFYGVPGLPRALLGVEPGGSRKAALAGSKAPEHSRRRANLGVLHADAYTCPRAR